MTKIYELRRKTAAYFETEFYGITVPMEFTMGTGNGGEQRAEMIVTDKFTQDAVEADPRYGKEYVLSATYGDDGSMITHQKEDLEDIPVVEEEPAPEPKKKARKPSKKEEGKTFSTLNDAVYYLEEELGIETNDNNINELLKKHNITIS